MSTSICMEVVCVFTRIRGMRSCIDGAIICLVSLSYFIAIGKANSPEIINPKRFKQLKQSHALWSLFFKKIKYGADSITVLDSSSIE